MPRKKAAARTKPTYDWIAEDLRPLAVPVDQLKLDPGNPRQHDEENIAAIAASLRQFGQLKPIVVHRKSKIIEAGNGTYLAAQQLGWSHLAVVWVAHDRTNHAAFCVADNRTAELAEWDDARLAELLTELRLEEEVSDFYEDLLLDRLGMEPDRQTAQLRQLDTKPPPAMSWVLVGIPTVRFGEISPAVEGLAAIDGIVLETTVNDGPESR